MYGLMVAFNPMRAAAVTRGHNKVLNFGNMATDSKYAETGDVGSGCNAAGRKRECWNCGGNHLKIKFLELFEGKKKDEYRKWYI